MLFTALLAGLLYLADTYLIPQLIHPAIWQLLVFFLVLSYVSHRIVSRRLQRDKDNIAGPYFATMALRLVLSIGVIIFFLYQDTKDIYVFVINFFILYLLFVGFEIYGLLSNLRRDSR